MKKNLILVAAILFAAKMASAQIEQGTQNLGINLTVQHNNTNGNERDYTDYSLSPSTTKLTYIEPGLDYSYFIADKFDVGADLYYDHQYNYNSYLGSTTWQRSNTYGGDIFIRKYLMCSSKFGFRVGPYFGYGNTKSNEYNYEPSPATLASNSSYNSITGSLRLDVVYYPVKHLGVSAMLADVGFSHSTGNDSVNGKYSSNTYSAQLISNVTGISLFYTFGEK
jgi:hypothetical protein